MSRLQGVLIAASFTLTAAGVCADGLLGIALAVAGGCCAAAVLIGQHRRNVKRTRPPLRDVALAEALLGLPTWMVADCTAWVRTQEAAGQRFTDANTAFGLWLEAHPGR